MEMIVESREDDILRLADALKCDGFEFKCTKFEWTIEIK